MSRKTLWSLLLAFGLFFGLVVPAQADGIIIPPEPPPCLDACPPPYRRPMAQLVIRYHHVTVTIENQLAVTHVDQVFFNPNSWPVEGTYIFPLPKDAVVSNFTLWVDGKPVKGEVLSADQARTIYQETVNKLRDPALLEYEGRGAVKASIFPIAPQGERRIELEYSQALTAENGLVRYVYPLNTEKFSMQPLEDVSIKVDIKDQNTIRAVYSPSHNVDTQQLDEHHAIAGYEASKVTPDQDFALYYSVGESQALHLFTYRDPQDAADPDGFFLLLLAPQPEQTDERIAKDVLLVLDRSGSMQGEKFSQAQAALKYILNHLNPEDRFHLLTFSTGIETYKPGLSPASEAPAAVDWVDGLQAAGSTDINRALLEAASVMDRERPTYLIFLTDGLPTQGEQDTQAILKNFAKVVPASLRLFAFGVGNDVDTTLLDSLSQEHHGTSTYVRPGEAIDEILSAFYEHISTPVLTDLKIDFGSVKTYDVYPNPLPDLFRGSQVVVVGRYHNADTTTINLSGKVNEQDQNFEFGNQVFTENSTAESGSLDMLPRLWATRKIGYLLNQIRLNGPDKETIDQIVKLSIRYGIVTPYTSYLVTEQMPLGQDTQNQIANKAYQDAQNAPAPSTGAGAVDRAAQEGAMQSANAAPVEAGGNQEGEQTIRVVGSRTFLLSSGVWIDTQYDPKATPTQKIAFLSPEYTRLLQARPDLAPALSLGDQVIVVVGGTAYEVVKSGESTGPVTLPTPLPQETKVALADPTSTPRSRIQPSSTPALVKTPIPAATEPAQRPLPARPATPQCIGLALPVSAVIYFILKRKK